MANATATTTSAGEQVTDTIAKGTSSAHQAVDKVAESVEKAASSVHPFITRSAQSAHEAVDKVAETVEPAAEWVMTRGEVLAAKGRSAEADARSYITAHPWQSVLMAAAVGYLFGRIARR